MLKNALVILCALLCWGCGRAQVPTALVVNTAPTPTKTVEFQVAGGSVVYHSEPDGNGSLNRIRWVYLSDQPTDPASQDGGVVVGIPETLLNSSESASAKELTGIYEGKKIRVTGKVAMVEGRGNDGKSTYQHQFLTIESTDGIEVIEKKSDK